MTQYGTRAVFDKDGNETEVEITNYVYAIYKDGRKVQIVELKTGTYVIDMLNSIESGRNTEQSMHLTKESLLAIFMTLTIYHKDSNIGASDILKLIVSDEQKIEYNSTFKTEEQ